MKEVTIDPAVLAKVAQLTGIKASPFPLFQTMPDGYVLRTTLRERFESEIKSNVWVAQYLATCNNAATPKAAAKIRRSARQLSEDLESSGLSLWFPASDIAAINHLAKQARDFERYGRIKSRAKAAEVLRKTFVSNLLDVADAAGGRLGINRRDRRGSLVEVIKLHACRISIWIISRHATPNKKRVAQKSKK